MRQIISLALVACALTLLMLNVGRRASLAHAAPVAQGKLKESAAGQNGKAGPQPNVETDGTPSTPQVVREVDLDGLKKLLQREPEKARPLLVTFWATWCEPCRLEFPDLVSIDSDYRKRGLEFIAISLDETTDIKTAVPDFLRQMHAQMPTYLLNVPDPEPAITAVDPTWGGALPATFLYDTHGQIIFKHMGRINPAELRTALDKVMSQK